MEIPANVSKASMFPPPEEREAGCSTMTVPEAYCEEKIEAQVLGGLQPMDGGPYGVSFFLAKIKFISLFLTVSYFFFFIFGCFRRFTL